MKQLFLLSFLVFVLGLQVSFAQSVVNVYNTDFESGQGMWTATNGLWEWGTPAAGVGPDAAHSGTKLIGTDLDGNYPPNANTMLKSPLISLPSISGNQEIWLRFYYWFDFNAFYNGDSVTVQISSNGSAFQSISSVSIKGSGAAAWSQFAVNISQFAGSTVQMGILFTSNGSSISVASGMYVDDFSIAILDIPFISPITFETPEELMKLHITSGLWEFGTPTDIGAAYEGIACAGTNFNGNYDANSNTCLELPEVLLTPIPGEIQFFSFYHFFDFNSLYVDDYGVVEISSDGGNTWSALGNQIFNASGWTYWGIPVSDYSGLSVKIRFCFHSNGSSNSLATGWYIDNISFSGIVLGAPVLTVSPGSLSFGSVAVGSSAPPQTVTVTNTGNATLNITGATVSGSGSTAYTVTPTTLTLAPGASGSLTVTFTPGSAGTFNANLNISSNGGSAVVSLSGSGAAAPVLTVSPGSLSFGSVAVGSSAPPQTVTVTNTGNATLNITGATVSGSGSTAYTVTPTTLTLAPGASGSLTVTFTPGSAGTFNANLNISSNGGSAVVSLSGSGAAAPVLTVSPGSLSFGSVAVGSSAPPQTVTVINTGNATLNVTGATVSGSGSTAYTVTPTTLTLAPGASGSLTVTFTPGSAGTFNANLNISSNGGSAVVSLSGSGAAAPVLTVSPGSLSFGSVAVGSSAPPQTVTVINTGNATLNVTGATVSGSGSTAYTVTPTTLTLAPWASGSLTVTFTPGSAGTFNANLNISSNGGSAVVSLSGSGAAAPVLTVSPASLSFGSVAVGSSAPPQTVTVTNTGNATLNVTGATVSGSGSTAYTVTPTTLTLAPGASGSLTVTFTPGSAGTFNANLNISSNGGSAVVSLSGSGAAAPVLTVSPGSLSFGSVAVGSSAPPQTVTVINTGNATLNVTGATVSGSGSTAYTVTPTTLTLAPWASGSLTVTFTPGSAGTFNANLNISSNGGFATVALSGTGIALPDPVEITIGTVEGLPNDTLLIPVSINLSGGFSLSSVELDLSGFTTSNLTFLSIVTLGSLSETAGWLIAHNLTSSLEIWCGGSVITTSGILFYIQVAVSSSAPIGFMPISVNSVLFNTGLVSVESVNGGVNISFIPLPGDVDLNGIVQAYDAALILQYLAGEISLTPQQLYNADVTLDGTVSALDASLILQWGVGLIPFLPVDTIGGGIEGLILEGSGNLSIPNQSVMSGALVAIPINISEGDNVLGFSGEIYYDAENFTFMDLIFSDLLDDFLTYVNSDVAGIVKIAGAGIQPDGETGTFVTLVLLANELPQNFQSEVGIAQWRWNEEETIFNSASGTLSAIIDNVNATHNSVSESLLVYPNPTTGKCTLSYDSATGEPFELAISNLSGQAVFTRKLETVPGKNTLSVDLQAFPQGVYYCRISGSNGVAIAKILLLNTQ